MIKEVIVVEGKDDLAAVKRACQAEVIITNGLGITAEKIAEIKAAQERCGVIILTDPDYPGRRSAGLLIVLFLAVVMLICRPIALAISLA